MEFQISDSYGGSLRNPRRGRKFRPLSKTEPLHLVFKANRKALKEKSFRAPLSSRLIQTLIRRYAQRFHVRIDQFTIQGDHLHLLVRCSHRFFFQAFFRVLAGQIAQRFHKEGLLHLVTDTPKNLKAKPKLWKFRPFSRVVRGLRAYRIVRDYIQLNEKKSSWCYSLQIAKVGGSFQRGMESGLEKMTIK